MEVVATQLSHPILILGHFGLVAVACQPLSLTMGCDKMAMCYAQL